MLAAVHTGRRWHSDGLAAAPELVAPLLRGRECAGFGELIHKYDPVNKYGLKIPPDIRFISNDQRNSF